MRADHAFREYFEAVVGGDRRKAFGIVEQASAAGWGLGRLYLQLFQPALREVGRLWQEDRLTVAAEHMATSITQAAMARAYAAAYEPGDRHGPVLLAAGPQIEQHDLGLRMLCDLLDLEGWETIFLGGSMPLADLVEFVREKRPDVVALSAALPGHVEQVEQAIRAIREQADGKAPLIIVGGIPFNEDTALARRVGADLTAPDAEAAVRLLAERFR